MRSISVELRFKIDKHRTTRSEFIIGDGLLKFCIAFVHFGVECGGVKFLPWYGKLVDEREVKTAKFSMVASLPLFVNVAVPQLAMKIAAAQRKTFRDTSVEFIWRSFKSPILRLLASTCQDLKSGASSGPNPLVWCESLLLGSC